MTGTKESTKSSDKKAVSRIGKRPSFVMFIPKVVINGPAFIIEGKTSLGRNFPVL
jgi:hypothetical protein